MSESNLLRFVAFAVGQGLKQQTIKPYLSAIRHLQVSCGGGDPRAVAMPQLELALRGAKREQAGQRVRPRLPITPVVLLKMRDVWQRSVSVQNSVMLWAACCLGFFGFLRAGEFTAPEDGHFDAGGHLSFKDISTNEKTPPQTMAVRIKQSKTDQFRVGVSIFLSKTRGVRHK